jgi:hypothetical protein
MVRPDRNNLSKHDKILRKLWVFISLLRVFLAPLLLMKFIFFIDQQYAVATNPPYFEYGSLEIGLGFIYLSVMGYVSLYRTSTILLSLSMLKMFFVIPAACMKIVWGWDAIYKETFLTSQGISWRVLLHKDSAVPWDFTEIISFLGYLVIQISCFYLTHRMILVNRKLRITDEGNLEILKWENAFKAVQSSDELNQKYHASIQQLPQFESMLTEKYRAHKKILSH